MRAAIIITLLATACSAPPSGDPADSGSTGSPTATTLDLSTSSTSGDGPSDGDATSSGVGGPDSDEGSTSGGKGSSTGASFGDSTGQETNGSESTGTESAGSESTGGESTGGESTGGESTGGESTGGESTGSEEPTCDYEAVDACVFEVNQNSNVEIFECIGDQDLCGVVQDCHALQFYELAACVQPLIDNDCPNPYGDVYTCRGDAYTDWSECLEPGGPSCQEFPSGIPLPSCHDQFELDWVAC